ncbi:outer membrane protein [Candidatus Berkiella aquae]|uniref:OmpA-like transmembrane domain protein n=1 Tax=Candidatus Berkiella aquae TaxID=295108 RepID=A0A0Q9YJC5_9GAMM|nr:outer membrane beta-barrel protein [Candidatus Berkiella aquae]MCS5710695.1 porin family protein [Candidatus Berkiella aquae]
MDRTKSSLGLLVATALLASTAAQAWEGNWLLGVSAGGAWHNNDDVGFTVTDGVTVESGTFSTDNDSHFIWGFLGGYQARCNSWLFGAELNVDWRGDHDNHASTTSVLLGGPVSGTLSRSNDAVWGLTARIGYEMSRYFMPYIRLGADYAHKDFDFTFTDAAGNVLSGDSGKSKWGFVGGVGLEFPLGMFCNNLSLRGEWDYHSRKHNHDSVTAVAADGTTAVLNAGNRHEQSARASLVYNF